LAVVIFAPGTAWAQFVQTRAVGGISIRADGLLENAGTDLVGRLSRERAAAVHGAPADLRDAVPLRKLSLARLEASLAEALKAGKRLSEEQVFLGGLQQIRYVFVYPEQKDIVLVGPAEGWKVDARGNVVGITTGKAVMMLDDLLVALRSTAGAGRDEITCSIDPTPEGLQQLKLHLAGLHVMGDPQQTAAGIEQATGRQQITFSGVPATSHFAEVLLAADYRMKRLAMNFDPSPIRALPSFLKMISARGGAAGNLMPRWWLEPKYDSVLRDPSGLAWELSSAGAQCMTEEEYLGKDGKKEKSGHASPLGQKWADSMTAHYAELAVAEPVFGELRNCMELAVVGALLAQQRLPERAGCSLPTLMDDTAMKAVEFPVPRQVDSIASMIQHGKKWTISVSGGIALRPFEILRNAEASDAPATARAAVTPATATKPFWN
jgi:hypothetical protein